MRTYSLYIGVSHPPQKHTRSPGSVGSSVYSQNPRKSDFGDPDFPGWGPGTPLKSDFRGLWWELRPPQDDQESSHSLDITDVP